MSDEQGFTADELAAVNRWLLAKGMELQARLDVSPHLNVESVKAVEYALATAWHWQRVVADQLSALRDAGGAEENGDG